MASANVQQKVLQATSSGDMDRPKAEETKRELIYFHSVSDCPPDLLEADDMDQKDNIPEEKEEKEANNVNISYIDKLFSALRLHVSASEAEERMDDDKATEELGQRYALKIFRVKEAADLKVSTRFPITKGHFKLLSVSAST